MSVHLADAVIVDKPVGTQNEWHRNHEKSTVSYEYSLVRKDISGIIENISKARALETIAGVEVPNRWRKIGSFNCDHVSEKYKWIWNPDTREWIKIEK